MTLFNRDPFECSSIHELQRWVANLQDMLESQREINRVLREQNGLLYHVNLKQGEEIALLKERGELLKERISQHEIGLFHHHSFRQN